MHNLFFTFSIHLLLLFEPPTEPTGTNSILFLSLFPSPLPLFPPQTRHHSDSLNSLFPNLPKGPKGYSRRLQLGRDLRLGIAKKLPQDTLFYPISESFASASGFMRVVNQGTPEFESLGVGAVFWGIDWQQLCTDLYDRSLPVSSRGNQQHNFGWTGSECTMRTQRNIESDFGSTMPQLRKDTGKYTAVLRSLCQLARIMGVSYASEEYTRVNPEFLGRHQLFGGKLGDWCCFEAFTVAFLLLNADHPPAAVKEHVDKQNDQVLTETLAASAFVCTHDGLFLRVTIVGYLRHNCSLSFHRREACQEASGVIKDFLSTAPAYLKPNLSIPAYYEQLGSRGMTLVTKDVVGKDGENSIIVVSAALLSLPSARKTSTYLSSVVHAVRRIWLLRQLPEEAIFELTLPILYCPGVFVYVSALHVIACDASCVPSEDGAGYFGLVLDLMRKISVCVSGGPHHRCQVSFTKDHIELARVDADLAYLVSLCQKSREDTDRAPAPQDEAHCQKRNMEITKDIMANVSQAGDIGAQHLVHVLAMLHLLAPIGVLRCCRMAASSSKHNKSPSRGGSNTKQSRVPKLMAYLRSGKGDGDDKTTSDRLQTVLRGAVLHVRATVRGEDSMHLTEAAGEGINCEHNRGRGVVDLHFPLAQYYTLDEADSLVVCTPTRHGQGCRFPTGLASPLRNVLWEDNSYGTPFWKGTSDAIATRLGSKKLKLSPGSGMVGSIPFGSALKGPAPSAAPGIRYWSIPCDALTEGAWHGIRHLFATGRREVTHRSCLRDVWHLLMAQDHSPIRLMRGMSLSFRSLHDPPSDLPSPLLLSAPGVSTNLSVPRKVRKKSKGGESPRALPRAPPVGSPAPVALSYNSATVATMPVLSSVSVASYVVPGDGIPHASIRQHPLSPVPPGFLLSKCDGIQSLSTLRKRVLKLPGKGSVSKGKRAAMEYLSVVDCGLYVHASNCSGNGRLKFTKSSFEIHRMTALGSTTKSPPMFHANVPMLGFHFNCPERCLVIDSVAKILAGRRMVLPPSVTGGRPRPVWGFPDPETARKHVLLSFVVVASTGAYNWGFFRGKSNKHRAAGNGDGPQWTGHVSNTIDYAKWDFLTYRSADNGYFLVVFDPRSLKKCSNAEKLGNWAVLPKSEDQILFVKLETHKNANPASNSVLVQI